MEQYEALNKALAIVEQPSATHVQADAALAVCAAYERALMLGDGGMKLPSYLMCALEALCAERGR